MSANSVFCRQFFIRMFQIREVDYDTTYVHYLQLLKLDTMPIMFVMSELNSVAFLNYCDDCVDSLRASMDPMIVDPTVEQERLQELLLHIDPDEFATSPITRRIFFHCIAWTQFLVQRFDYDYSLLEQGACSRPPDW